MSALLSFGLPVYNGEEFIAAALGSLREQDYPDLEIVVSDNGSTDATEEIVRAVAADDERVRYVRVPENRGGAFNYMNVVEHSRGELFSWMAADDVKLPTFGSECAAVLAAEGPGAVFACPHTRLIDADGIVFEDLRDARLGLDAPYAHQRIENVLRSQASHVMYGVIRRAALDRTRGVLPIYGDDMVFIVELLCQGRMVRTPGQTFLQRRHPQQFSAQGDAQVKWHAPDAKVRFAFPQTQLNTQLYRAVANSDLTTSEKVRCWGVIGPAWAFPRWRGMARDVANAVGIPR